tara:strand:- start:1044 stop:1832 length:789 start_codon:yes stop_codon:yes gene_type:complete
VGILILITDSIPNHPLIPQLLMHQKGESTGFSIFSLISSFKPRYLKRMSYIAKSSRAINAMKLNNIITKSICFFCFLPAILKPVHLFAQSDLQEIDTEINITLDGKKLSIHISLNEPFRWKNTRYESLKKFPQPWIGLPDIPNEIWFKSRADMEMRITDMMFIGEYEVLEKFKVASMLFGVGEVMGVFNTKSNLLKFDNLDYAPFYPTPRIVLEESIDMKRWNKVNLSHDLPKQYRWPEEIKIDLHISGVRHKFFRVKIQDR